MPPHIFTRKIPLSCCFHSCAVPCVFRFLWTGTVSWIASPSREFRLGKSRLLPSGNRSHLLIRNVDNDPHAIVRPFPTFVGPIPPLEKGRKVYWATLVLVVEPPTSTPRFLADRVLIQCSTRLTLVILSQPSFFVIENVEAHPRSLPHSLVPL